MVAAILAALLRQHMRHGKQQQLLVAIDELPAVGLRNLSSYLATCGGYGMTLLLYIQSIAQLQTLYGTDGTRTILSNCDHQVWYPSADMETARIMSQLYGTTYKANPMQSSSHSAQQHQDRAGHTQQQRSHNQGASWSWREAPLLSPNEMIALPTGNVLVTTRRQKRYLFLGQRLNSISHFERLPGTESLDLPPHLTTFSVNTRIGTL